MSEIAVSASQRTDPADRVGHGGLFLVFGILALFLAAPLAAVLVQSVEDKSGTFVALDNFAAYLKTPALAQSLWNSLYVAIASTVIVLPLAFVYAYALTRSCMRYKGLFRPLP